MTSTWFERAVRPEHVAEELRRTVPELAGGGEQLVGCRMIRLRAGEEAGHWGATYLLDLARPDGTQHTVSAQGTLVPPDAPAPDDASPVPFGGDGWRLWLPGARVLLQTWARDEGLPGLAALTDPSTAPGVLQRVLRASRPDRAELELAEVTATVASYKPGVRATLVCDLAYVGPDVPPGWPAAVVAKAAEGAESLRVHEAQRAVWGALADSPLVTVAEPLGHVPELGLAVQGNLEHEETLKDRLDAAFGDTDRDAGADRRVDAAPAVRATAAALAALHTGGVAHGAAATWDDELETVWRKHENLAAVVPWLSEHTAGVLERLRTAGGATPPDPLAASHGSFRAAQVLLLAGGGIGLIDLDKLRRAEPAADVGPFLAKLRHTAVNKGGEELPDEATAADRDDRVDRLRAEFLEAYREHAPLAPARLAVWEGLEYLSLVLGSAKKGLPDRAASCAAMLHRHLRDHDL